MNFTRKSTKAGFGTATEVFGNMANRARNTIGGRDEFTIHLSHLEMLKLEKLLKILDNVNGAGAHLGSEENEWLSNALMLFAPELPSGGYEI